MEEEFLSMMEGLVSNERLIREENLEKITKYLNQLDDTLIEDKFPKIWRSLFYFFWNADKPIYQRQMAEKIGKITEEFDKNKAEQWIKFFLQEFIKKFSLIDFLRMDKYIMLTEVILKNFLIHSNKEGNLDSILQFIQFFSSNLHCGNYNFCFVSIVIKIISTFIQEMSKEFIFLHFSALLDRLLELFLNIKDKREIKTFQDTIFNKIVEKVKEINEDDNEENVKIKNEVENKFFTHAKSKDETINENKRSILYKFYKRIKYNREPEEEQKKNFVVDPVNDYILQANYTTRIRLNPREKMKLMILRQKNKKRAEDLLKEKQKEINNQEIFESSQVKIDEEEIKMQKGKEDLSNGHMNTSNGVMQKNEKDDSEMDEEEQDSEYEEEEEFEEEELVEEGQEFEEGEFDDEEYELDEWAGDINQDDLNLEDLDEEEYELWDMMPNTNLIKKIGTPSEEDKSMLEAYINACKNEELVKPPKKNHKNNNGTNSTSKNDFLEKKRKSSNEDLKVERKNSLSKKPKKKVIYALNKNEVNNYDQQKPILLTTKLKNINSQNNIAPKSLLKKVKK